MIARQIHFLRRVAFLGLVLGWACSMRTTAQDANTLVVVVNKSNSAASALNKTEIKKILLGDKLQWPNGGQIAVIFEPPGNADRTAVLQAFCGMSEAVFTRRQLQASFSGGTPVVIREVQSAAEVKAALKTSPLAVGFLQKKDVDDSIRVVMPVE